MNTNLHMESCPYCSEKIEISYGVVPCPKCHKLIRCTPDNQEVLKSLVRIFIEELSMTDIGKIIRRLL